MRVIIALVPAVLLAACVVSVSGALEDCADLQLAFFAETEACANNVNGTLDDGCQSTSRFLTINGFLAMKKKMTKQVEKAGREHVITICEN
jgi:hypothetical protein